MSKHERETDQRTPHIKDHKQDAPHKPVMLSGVVVIVDNYIKDHKQDAPHNPVMLSGVVVIYYIKLQFSLSVCLSVPPFFPTRPSDRNQIWHTYSGRCGTHSQLIFFDPAHPRGNITSYVTSSNVEYVRHLKTTARRSMT